MTVPIGESEARFALSSLQRQRQQVIAQINVPHWYWFFLAGGWVVLGVLADFAPGGATIVATLAFGAVHAGISPRVLSGRRGSSQLSVRSDLVSRRLPALVIGFLLVMTAVTVGLALALNADGARMPPYGPAWSWPCWSSSEGPGWWVRCAVTPSASTADVATPRFDELIHPSTRLSIVALLAATDWAEFSFVRDRLELSDSALSKQFATLEDAGYITVERTVSNRRRRVRVALTPAGRGRSTGTSPHCRP